MTSENLIVDKYFLNISLNYAIILYELFTKVTKISKIETLHRDFNSETVSYT